jgi:hypothetical protein
MRVEELRTHAHCIDVEDLAELHHDEFGSSREFSRGAVGEACYRCISDKRRDHLNCWIAYTEYNKPIGYIAGTLDSSFYSYRDYAVQQMWYVVHEHRGSKASLLLLQAFEQWAMRHNAERIYMQVEHDDNEQIIIRTISLMNRLGYRNQGYIAVKTPTVEHLLQAQARGQKDADDSATHRAVVTGQAAQTQE